MMLDVSNSFTRYRVMFQTLKDLLRMNWTHWSTHFSLLLYSCQSTHKSSPRHRDLDNSLFYSFNNRRLIGFISRIYTIINIWHTETERATLMRILLLLMLFVMQWYLLLLTAFIPFPFRPLGASATYMYSETSLVWSPFPFLYSTTTCK